MSTIIEPPADSWLVTVALDDVRRPQRVGQVLALRLGRRSVDDIEVLVDGRVWWTVGRHLRVVVEPDRKIALHWWPPLGGWAVTLVPDPLDEAVA